MNGPRVREAKVKTAIYQHANWEPQVSTTKCPVLFLYKIEVIVEIPGNGHSSVQWAWLYTLP